MIILGISCYYHDSAAALIKDGDIIAAAQEERFTRKKHDQDFPRKSIDYCLNAAGITIQNVDLVAFYDKPFLKFERLLESYLAYAPKGLLSAWKGLPIWIKDKLWISDKIKTELGYDGKLIFPEHHQSHAASAFFPSPFNESAILTMDGVGEWTTTSLAYGHDNKFEILAEQHFPHSLGLLYSAFTYYTGFKVNSGEYKLMGLAPYGKPVYYDSILENLIDLKDDGSFIMDQSYFNYTQGLTMTGAKFHKLFGGAPRKPETPISQKEMDIAASIQKVTEEIVYRAARYAKITTGSENLCLAGGVALNCVANGKLKASGLFKNIWVQPSSGDAGGALGSALYTWYQYLDNARDSITVGDHMKGAYLGPEWSAKEVSEWVNVNGHVAKYYTDDELYQFVSENLVNEQVVGWFQGRMEFGPRALGNRSILGDPRSEKMQKILNVKIKFRESFRPFAPSVLEEYVSEYFEFEGVSPYMLMVAPVKNEKTRRDLQEKQGFEKLYQLRSELPAITHVDFSARIQTVNKNINPRYHALISAFKNKTGVPVIINTSFNVRGEPIVCSPDDAYRCFMRTNMDVLVVGNYVFMKKDQPQMPIDSSWQKEYELD